MKRELTDFHIAAAELVAAYVSMNEIKPERIPELLQIAYRGLLHMDAPPATLHALPKNYSPAPADAKPRGKSPKSRGPGKKPKK